MVTDSRLQVLIVGGGISGLTFAGAIASTDIEPVVVESTDAVGDGTDPGLVELWPDALTLLRDLGISAHAPDAAVAVDTWTRRQPDGTVLLRRESDTAGVVTLPYTTLRTQLRDEVPAGIVQSGRTLESITPENSYVVATFANGVREQFDLVVGADGARSRTRASLGGRPPSRFGTRTWTIPVPAWRGETTEVWTTEGVVFSVLPTGDGAVGYLTLPAAELTRQEANLPGVAGPDDARAIVDWVLPTALDEASDREIRAADDVQSPTDAWGERRVALVGDAAHVRHRLTSLGPTLAIEDAVTLASELSQSDDTVRARVGDYSARRQARLDRLETASPERLDATGADIPDSYRSIFEVRNAQIEAHFGRTADQPR